MIIEIENLRFDTIIGILDFERVKKQQVIVNLKAKYKYKKGNFINYVDLSNIIKDSMNNKKFELLEDAIEYISNKIETKYPQIESLYLKITKPDILNDCKVSLSNSVTI